MIVLDTHIWIWWMNGDSLLTQNLRAFIQAEVANGLGISAISCWEVAKLVQLGRLQLRGPIDQWLSAGLQPPVQLIPLSPEISIEATRLPGHFHRDPADQIIVATARILDCPLVIVDHRIRVYPHVRLAP